MPYCSKCGKEIKQGVAFCGNCGNQIVSVKSAASVSDGQKSLDVKRTAEKAKEFFSHFYVDYDSKIFKFSMILLLAFGAGVPVFNLIMSILPFKISEVMFDGAYDLLELLTCLVLFGVLIAPILRKKHKTSVKRSDLLTIFWIVSNVLNVFVFFAGDLYHYILFSNYASEIIKTLAVVSTVALLLKNRPKRPFVLMLSALSFALSNSTILLIQLEISLHNLSRSLSAVSGKQVSFINVDILRALVFIVLTVVLFLLMYLIPRKVSKWMILVPTLGAEILILTEFSDDYLAFVPNYLIQTGVVLFFALAALSCTRQPGDYAIVKNKKSALKVSVASASLSVVVVVSYLLISAIVCGTQINSGIEKWHDQIIAGNMGRITQWDEMESDIFEYSATKFVAPFVDEYSLYKTLDENRDTMEDIAVCYAAYHPDSTSGTSSYIAKKFSEIPKDVVETWKSKEFLRGYYDKYMSMKPKAEKIIVSATIDVAYGGRIDFYVKNDNAMPVSECTVNYNFTLMFIPSDSYSGPKYERGSKTVVVKDINGKSSETETVYFDPDDYYDSYGSYILVNVVNSDVSVISVK